MVAISFAGSTPLTRMLVVSVKLLNIAPSLIRSEYASTEAILPSTCSTFATIAGCMLRFSGRLSIEAT